MQNFTVNTKKALYYLHNNMYFFFNNRLHYYVELCWFDSKRHGVARVMAARECTHLKM